MLEQTDLQMNPGFIIHNRRRELKMSMRFLSEKTNIHLNTLKRIESDKNYNPGWHIVVSLLNNLGVDVTYREHPE